MGYTEAQIIARIATALFDPSTALYSTAQIRNQMDQALREIAQYSPPNVSKATVTFGSTARELSISAISNLLWVEQIEYPVDYYPKRYRVFQRRGSTVVLDLDFVPSSGDTAYVWYRVPHTVSGTTTNTLDPEQERILIELTAGQLMINNAISKVNTVNTGGGATWKDFQQWGERKVAKAMEDLRAIAEPRVKVDWPTVW